MRAPVLILSGLVMLAAACGATDNAATSPASGGDGGSASASDEVEDVESEAARASRAEAVRERAAERQREIDAEEASQERIITSLVQQTCGDLNGTRLIELPTVLNPALDEAETVGLSGPEFGDMLRRECPDLMRQIDDYLEETSLEEDLPGLLEAELEFDGCFSGDRDVTGAITNPIDEPINVSIEVDFLAEDGTLVEDSSDYLDLDPNQRGLWEASTFGVEYDDCKVSIGSARITD